MSARLRRQIGLAVTLAAVLIAPPVRATLTIPTDLADVVSIATVIVRGRVIDTRAFTEMANGPVVTAVTLSIADVLKGNADRTLTFRVHGGDLGRYRQVIIGEPTFVVGDDAYVFLKRASEGALWTVGMSAGVYKITSTGATGALMVNPPVVAGVTATVGAQIVRGDVRRNPMGIGDFAGVVKLLMTAAPDRGAGPGDVKGGTAPGRIGGAIK